MSNGSFQVDKLMSSAQCPFFALCAWTDWHLWLFKKTALNSQ
jgi:hypothetical protein